MEGNCFDLYYYHKDYRNPKDTVQTLSYDIIGAMTSPPAAGQQLMFWSRDHVLLGVSWCMYCSARTGEVQFYAM